jgi:hypothetical protein
MPTFGSLRLEYTKHLETISANTGYRLHEVWPAFLRLSSCCIVGPDMQRAVTLDAMERGMRGWSRIASLPDREAEFEAERQRWDAESMTLFSHAMAQMMIEAGEHTYRDVLGPVHQEWLGKKGQQWGGEFHTPYEISRLMAFGLCGDATIFDKPEPVTIQEPACGSGQLVLALVEWMHERGLNSTRIRLEAWDVSAAAVDMALINLTLHGVPARVIRGNTLSLEVWNTYYTPFYPLAHGAPDATESTPAPPQPEPRPVVNLRASQQLEQLLRAQESIFSLETE